VRDYATPAAFRAAVEATLRERARRLKVPAYIVRRQAALERLIVRLMTVAPSRWALKGGMAIESRLGDRARASLGPCPRFLGSAFGTRGGSSPGDRALGHDRRAKALG
jgi:hypothetical protein